jgi:hypothetical protein
MKTLFAILFMAGCASSTATSTTPEPPPLPGGACAEGDCGPVPPVTPTACPSGTNVSTVCTRNEAGTCHWQVRCT